MRRVVGIVAAAALVLALFSAVAAAADLPASTGSYDLGSQLMLRLFGETSDANASFAAARGDRASESPLRELALAIPSAGATPLASASATAAAFGQSRLTLGDLYDASSAARFSPGTPLNDDIVALMPSSALFTASYQPVTPEPSISPAPGTLAFAPVTAAAGDESLPATPKAAFVPSTTQVGPVRFEGHSDSATLQTPQLDLRDNTYGARANLDLRAGKRDLNLNVSSEYDQVASGGANAFTASTLTASSWQLPGGAARPAERRRPEPALARRGPRGTGGAGAHAEFELRGTAAVQRLRAARAAEPRHDQQHLRRKADLQSSVTRRARSRSPRIKTVFRIACCPSTGRRRRART